MTGTGPDTPVRRWAAKQLGISPDAGADSARAALLQRLPELDFVPPTEPVDAASVFGALPGNGVRLARARLETLRENEAALREEVEKFARIYWETLPTERSQLWAGLLRRAGELPSRRLEARLRELKSGLNIRGPQLTTNDDPAVADLASRVCALYILRPVERARQWQKLLNEARPMIWHWKQTAARFRASYPAIAELQPDVVDELASREPPPQFAPPHRPKPKQPHWLFRKVSSTTLFIIFFLSTIVRLALPWRQSDSHSPFTPPAPAIMRPRSAPVPKWPEPVRPRPSSPATAVYGPAP